MTTLPQNTVILGGTTPSNAELKHNTQTGPKVTDLAANYWLAALDASGVRFALLRGYSEAKPEPGSDVDLLVEAADLENLHECLEVACEHSGARIVQTFQTPHSRQYMLHGRTECGQHSLLTLDVHTSETCYGVAYLHASDLLPKAELQEVPRFADAHSGRAPLAPCIPQAWAGLVRFQNGFLSGGEVQIQYVTFFAKADHGTQEAMAQSLRAWFGSQMGNRILHALREADPTRLQALAKAARRRLLWRRLRYAPWGTTSELFRTASALRMRPYLKPRGLCVAFLGTDGSGKSTLIEALRTKIEHHYRDGKNSVRKLRPGFLPQINRLVHWRKSSYSAEDCTSPHRAKASGALGSTLRASWYGLDCLIGWPLRILPLRRRNALLIFDRYYPELLVDPHRARIRHGSLAVRFWSRIVPKPDTTLVCVASPECILERKQELPADEIARQVEGYETLARSLTGAHLIRTDHSLQESLDQVLCAVYASQPNEHPQMSPEAPNLPGKPQLWYSLVRPCKGIQRMIVCRSESTDLASEIDANYEQLEPGHSLVVVHQRTQLPIPNDAWAETFLVLPSSGGAQALLSTASADAFRLGIPLLPGGRLKTRLMRAALWLPGVLQALCRQKRERMSVITKPADGHDEGNWRMYQTPVAVVEGVPGSLQKLVVLHRDGEHQHIYKLAGTVLARRAIQHEVKALTTLGGCGLAPRLVARDYGLDPNWFAQEILHGKRPKAQITPAVLTWLVSLATREHDHLGPQTVIPSLFDGRDWSKLGPEFERLANITRYCWTGGSIPCTQSHGDFTPWNARITEGGLVAFDWEFYNPIRPALFDLFHFILQCSVLLRQVPAEQAMDRAMRILRGPAQPLCRVAGVQDFEIEPLAALYLLLVAERDSILHQIECPEFDQVAWLTEARKLWATQLAEHLEKMMEGYKQAG